MRFWENVRCEHLCWVLSSEGTPCITECTALFGLAICKMLGPKRWDVSMIGAAPVGQNENPTKIEGISEVGPRI